MYHHSLVKIMIVEELANWNDSWDNFINQNMFKLQNNEVVAEDDVEQGVNIIKNGLDEYLDSHIAAGFISHPTMSWKWKVVRNIPTVKPSIVTPPARRITKNMAKDRKLQGIGVITLVPSQHT